MRRIPAYDGLRAFACLAVLAVHSRLPGAGAGGRGVDVFFVLSGYLITALLLTEKERSRRIRIGRFYLRRAARLYPALVVLVVLGVPLAKEFADDHGGYSLTVGLTLTYLTNFWIWYTGSSAGGFKHTWSLAVEEQFYLFWPIIVIITRSRRVLWWVAATLAVISLVLCQIAYSSDGLSTSPDGPEMSFAYYLPHTRGWELFAGCALAAWATTTPSRRQASTLLWCGVGVSILMPVLAHATWRSGVPDLQTVSMVITTLATVLLLAGLRAPTGHLVERFLSRPTLVWIGQRSYGIYLFQALGLWVGPKVAPAGGPRFIVVTAVSVTVAAVSYRLVERPLQRRLYRHRPLSANSPTVDLNTHEHAQALAETRA